MDMMNMMFGGGGGGMGGRQQQRRRKGKDVGMAYPVSLEDLYKGKTATLNRDKTILCPKCKGSGSNKPGGSAVCQTCRGQGARMMMRQVGPGMIQQMQVPCEACNGRGSNITEADKCQPCRGTRTKNVEAPLKVVIQPGMSHNDQIPFRMEGDQDPDIDVPGDIVVVLQALKHDKFVREGNELHVKHSITLDQALCGFQTVIEQLDGRKLVIRHDPATHGFIKPGDKKSITGEGMPIHDAPGKKAGDLVVTFEVKFPERLDESVVEALRAALPPAPKTTYDEEHEECYLSRQPLDELKKEMEKEAEDDDDGDGSGPGIRCAQQ